MLAVFATFFHTLTTLFVHFFHLLTLFCGQHGVKTRLAFFTQGFELLAVFLANLLQLSLLLIGQLQLFCHTLEAALASSVMSS